ncbi:hypothetical protein HS041_12360 [Planomonospora sp. ID67723]|uniref:hypothetical protein n=1 Tax=Planomonospora sp. ID67723 TaxID=2738134 RepID=UPI0018C42BBF|nr:hypothetical protein [Planomonospora sp. ID67723]MBG0828562.1 hypothetical protein [Planomonospora sp. ID67723]
MPWDPNSGQTFGEWLRGGAPLGQGRTADVITTEPTWLTRDQVHEGRREDGTRVQHVTDQLGHNIVRETTSDGRERQHVRINLR